MSLTLNRAENINAFFGNRSIESQAYFPSNLSHVYIKLDFEKKYENADSPTDAKSFLRSVTRASILTNRVASDFEGHLVEVQGSLLHVILPTVTDTYANIVRFASSLNSTLNLLFSNKAEKVRGWRMIADSGKTLLVKGLSIHGDESTVSLGNAANRPAKRLYQQFAEPEKDRTLKRGYLEIRNQSGGWKAINLGNLIVNHNFSNRNDQVKEIRELDLSNSFENKLKHVSIVNASATPVGSPTSNDPHISWGWILRADLDGFTQRVSSCYDSDSELTKLATEFVSLMNKAATFAENHSEMIIQLPWAGDNFNAVANYPDKLSYETAVEDNLIGLSVDFEEDLHESAINIKCGGWSQCVAGGFPHGNSSGNVYVSSIPVDDRNFLVGVGMGIGKSLQAMSDISPDVQELVLYNDDHAKIRSDYQTIFFPSIKTDSETVSALYKSADVKELEKLRDHRDTSEKTVSLTSADKETAKVVTRPYSHG